MINQFLMEKRCCSRLEKYVSDRVWSEPYAELRTNTRPRILNSRRKVTSTESGVTTTKYIYTATSGVLTGTGEQVGLPSGSSYYVYSIELNQFRSIKLNATEWVTLEEYCNASRTDIRIYGDEGIVLWRAGIYIKQDAHAEFVYIAVDSRMLHRCMDKFGVDDDGNRVVIEEADPSAVYFTKYVESDYSADNRVKCIKFDKYAINNLKRGVSDIPSDASIMFCNGRVLTGSLSKVIAEGDYVECIVDADVVSDPEFYIDRNDGPIYEVDGKSRLLVHIPRAYNPKNIILTYNVCDVYILPKSVTTLMQLTGYYNQNSGVYFHIGDRRNVIHQLTHNDFSIDLDLLDSIASNAGVDFKRDSDGNSTGTLDYVIKVVVRLYIKKNAPDITLRENYEGTFSLAKVSYGAVRDANYIDLLYSDSHDDEKIVKLLLNDSEYYEYNMYFWTAAHLEKNNFYSKAMMQRVGPTTSNDDNVGFYRAPTEKKYISGKEYFQSYSDERRVEKSAAHEDLGNGVVELGVDTNYSTLSPEAGAPIDDGSLEFKLRDGVRVDEGTQCRHCGLFDSCAGGGRRHDEETNEVMDAFTAFLCPEFSYRSINDYVKILGYYHTLSLICKRVTTYYIKSLPDDTLENISVLGSLPYTVNGETIDVTVGEHKTLSRKNMITVVTPLALYDLDYNEFYPIVYLNGTKIDSGNVEVIGFVNYDIPGLKECHWTYTPTFGENIMWEEDQRRLLIKLNEEEVTLKQGDYITIEVLPQPEDDYIKAVGSTETKFNLAEYEDNLTAEIPEYAFQPIGTADKDDIDLKSSELVYLNGKQLVAGIDYTAFSEYAEGDLQTIIQNIQYLKTENNVVNYTTTTDVTIGSAKGFVVGNWIPWNGISPFWFDNLSVLTVGGRVCSNFGFWYSGLDIRGEAHQNGEPYMVRTLVPKSVLDMMSTADNLEAREDDDAKYVKLRKFFERETSGLGYRAVIPYSHKVYSTYMLAIINDLLEGIIDFELYLDKNDFLNQFDPTKESSIPIEKRREYEKIKKYDVVFSDTGLSDNDIRFADVYPVYHNFDINSNKLKRKIDYLVTMLSRTDEIRHREHINVR